LPLGPDYSRLLEVPHIYTMKQLAALRLAQGGESRSEICKKLKVSSSRVSQLLKAALDRHAHHEAHMRALVTLELRELGASEAAGTER
jgi:transcriptional regulator